MRLPAYLTRPLLLSSALLLAPSCAGSGALTPPADLFERRPEPVLPDAAVTDGKAYERWRADQADWGRWTDAKWHAACLWMREAGVGVRCE